MSEFKGKKVIPEKHSQEPARTRRRTSVYALVCLHTSPVSREGLIRSVFCAVICLHRRKLDLAMSSRVPVKIIISHFTVKINFKGAVKFNFKGAEQLDFYFNTDVARVI